MAIIHYKGKTFLVTRGVTQSSPGTLLLEDMNGIEYLATLNEDGAIVGIVEVRHEP
jgi:hypothetical protein